MNVNEEFAEFLEKADRDWRAVDKGPAARFRDDATEQEAFLLGPEAALLQESVNLLAQFLKILVKADDGRDFAGFFFASNDGGGGASSGKELDGTDDKRLAGAGFAGDSVHAWAEVEVEFGN